MNLWFGSKKEQQKLADWMKRQPNFIYDKSGVKARLLASVKNFTPEPETEESPIWSRRPSWGLVLAALVIMMGSATFAYADEAKPGDILFPINKLNDRIILSLPFNAPTKARIQAQIVSRRLDALNQLSQPDNLNEVGPALQKKRLQTVRESDQSLSTAIEKVTESKKALEAKGNQPAVEQLRKTLTELEDLAGQQETKVQRLEDKTSDADVKKQLNEHLQEIKKARQKAAEALRTKAFETKNQR